MIIANKIKKVIVSVIAWSFMLGISVIGLGFIVRGILSVWSFIL